MTDIETCIAIRRRKRRKKARRIQRMREKTIVMIVRRWLDFLEGRQSRFLSPDLTDGSAAYHFVQAKYNKKPYPRTMSLAFTPQQVVTPAGSALARGDILRFLGAVANRERNGAYARSFLWSMQGSNPTMSGFFSRSLPTQGCRLPLDFPATTAADIYDEFCPDGGNILDPCHGWGGRMIGFLLASRPREYVGIDPSPVAHNGVDAAYRALAEFAEPYKKITLIQEPFERAPIKGPFDFAFTSPPYFDVEIYDGEEQSVRLYPTFAAWCDGFYRQLFERTFRFLRSGAIFALNVGSQTYPLGEKAEELGPAAGFEYLEKRTALIKLNNCTGTPEERGESLFLFRKPK